MVRHRHPESSPFRLHPVRPSASARTGSFARRTDKSTAPILAFALLSFAMSGCNSCERDRPYVPFPADSAPSLPSAADSAALAPANSAAPTSEPELLTEARRVEPPSGRIEVAGRPIELPKQSVAEWSLEQDFTGDGQVDALLWTHPAAADEKYEGPLAELWFFPAGGDAKVLFRMPGWLPSGTGCVFEPHLQGFASGQVWLEVRSRCQGSLPQRTPTRLYAMFAPTASRAQILGLRGAEPAEGESLSISPKLSDRDGDGRPDPAIAVSLAHASTGTTAQLELGWLDRAAGASVDDSHFAKALEPTLRAWESRLGRKATGQDLGKETYALRRLVHSLCQQAATPRIWDIQGDGIRCPGLPLLGPRLTRIEIKSALLANDLGLALRSLSYATTWIGGLPTVEREGFVKLFDKQLTVVKPSLPVTVSVRPKPSKGQPRFSPLAFDADGNLSIYTEANVLVRAKPDGTSAPVDADAETPWPLEVTAPDGRKWSSVVPACDRSEMLLASTLPNGSFAPLAPLELLSPRPGVCKNPIAWPVALSPIAWSDTMPTAIIDGYCSSAQGSAVCQAPSKLGPVRRGSPRSPDGRKLVFVSTLGPIVYGGAKPERWDSSVFDARPLTDCVVSNEAQAIACVQQGKVLWVTRSVNTP